MKKPNRKDFPNGMNGRSRYLAALRRYEDYTKRQQKKIKEKTSYKDILGFTWKKEGNKYVQYRGDGSKTGKTKLINKSSKDKPKDKPKYVGPYERKHGKKQPNVKSSKDLKVKKEPYAKDRVGKVDLNSKEYKEAKRINEQTTSTPIKRLSKEEREKHKKIAKNERLKIKKDEANKKGEEKAKNATTTGGPVKDGVKYARSKGDDLAGFRRTKDTRITKSLKKSGFTEDRLARLRKQHAEFKARRKKKKKK
jgi:hypothetical protein